MNRAATLLLPFQRPAAMISPDRLSLASMAFIRASRSAQIRRVCSCFFSRSAVPTAVRTPGPIEADASLTVRGRGGGRTILACAARCDASREPMPAPATATVRRVLVIWLGPRGSAAAACDEDERRGF